MEADKKVLAVLNAQLKNELTAINQYFLHARTQRHWHFGRIGKHTYEESIEEMKHADRLIERILTLGGLPNLQDLGKLLIGESVPEMLACDLKLELLSHATIRDAIGVCEAARDYVSRDLFVDLQSDTEEHIDWLEEELAVIEKVGVQNYLQSQLDSTNS